MTQDIWPQAWRKRQRNGRMFVGLVILAIGILELLKAIGISMPGWIFSWPMLLIVIGGFILVKHQFRHPASYLLLLLGLCFLILDNLSLPFRVDNLVWPSIIIVIGLSMLLSKKRSRGPFIWDSCGLMHGGTPSGGGANPTDTGGPSGMEGAGGFAWNPPPGSSGWSQKGSAADSSEVDRIDMVAVFGGSRRVVISKNFKGGDGVAICGGMELNLLQADMEETAVLDLVAICGGIKLLVPANWEVRSNVVHLFSGMDDKRSQQPGTAIGPTPGKVLLLTGTCLFAGIEIRSF